MVPITLDTEASGENCIGTTGGWIAIGDEGTLSVPYQALNEEVCFTVAEHTVTPDAHWAELSTAWDIGPDGTTFNVQADLTLLYDENDLNGVDESEIDIYRLDEGKGWVALDSDVDEEGNEVTAKLSGLSVYQARVELPQASEGVYAELLMHKEVMQDLTMDRFSARFDNIVDPEPVNPQHPDSVVAGEYKLAWEATDQQYVYDLIPVLEVIELDSSYEYVVHASDDVPDLNVSLTTPAAAPYFTDPTTGFMVDIDGFTANWTGTGADNVTLSIYQDGPEPMVEVVVPNNGSYTFTSAQLEDCIVGYIDLEIVSATQEAIDAPGYDPNSFIRAQGVNRAVLQTTEAGSVAINPEPDSINAPWTITGPQSYNQSGNGDTMLPGLLPGEYTVSWEEVAGWDTPPAETQTLAPLGSLNFAGVYTQTK